MNLVDATKSFFIRWNDFRGRSIRSEYWWAVLAIGILSVVLEYSLRFLVGDELGLIILLPFSLFVAIAGIALAVRRLHDMDRTGWWYLLNFTIIGIFILLVWYCFRGTIGDNRYGADPLNLHDGPGHNTSIIE